ncbi:ribosome biogenesis GTP-binding protein YihA/YsxC [Salisaeta longa]|uniref:ribosome biogenesis GTP-binding protein YihA/YsxC n=1 Tax=Salisaeta longa TaxID=503170 RepID=UPI00048AC775|nr:ribosome biogenesis GTP-binding protein YihA/YsxC [Salisaeta longa]
MTINTARFIIGAAQWQQLPTDGRPEMAFIGRSNVGKSSLLNALTGQKNLAYTSKRPGKTQEFNYFLVNDRFYMVDVPGYGYARVSKKKRKAWAAFIERYLTERVPLRAVFHLMDSRHPLTDLDRELIDFMRGGPVPYVLALTKVDKLSGNQRTKAEQTVRRALDDVGLEVPLVLTSSKSKRGHHDLRTWMDRLLNA